jgi:integrase
MPWAELDGADWTLAAARNKTKQDLLRPLPKAALDVLGAKPDNAAFVFSTDGGMTPLSGYSKLKAVFDRACGELPNWTLHDLRRTARTLLTRAKVPAEYAERCLGHTIAGVEGIYNRHEYRDEKAQAYEALARQIDFIVHRRIISVTLRRREAEANE